MSGLLLVLLSSVACRTLEADEVLIRPDSVIVVGDAPSETERFAAAELARYLQAITGGTFPVASGSGDATGTVLSVGKTTYSVARGVQFPDSDVHRDSFVIAADDAAVVLVGGGDRGTLYAVYEFLEQQGCRWFFPGRLGEVIPRRGQVRAVRGERLYAPDFVQREIDMGSVPGIDVEEVIDWAVKNRLNRIFGLRDGLVQRRNEGVPADVWRKRGGAIEWQWICHNFNWMVPSDKHYAEHPEYFALYNGRRLPLGSEGRPSYGGGNLCTTNPDVVRIAAEFAAGWFDAHPNGAIVPLWPADGTVKWCECEACRALGGENFTSGGEGSMTRRMVSFANAVAAQLPARHPNRKLLIGAYANYRLPVPDVPIDNRVVVQYCFHGCYAHGPEGCEANRQAAREMDQWASQVPGRLGMWEYFLLGNHYTGAAITPATLPVASRARDTIRFLRERGGKYYFTQSSAKYWKHNILPFFVTARLAWDADQDFDALLDDFFDAFYGVAAAPLARFHRLIEDATQTGDWHPQVYSDVAAPSPRVFTEENVAKLETWLTTAERSRPAGVYGERVALVREAFEFTKSSVETQRMSGMDGDAVWRVTRGEDAYVINAEGRELGEDRRRELISNALDMGGYNAEFRRTLFRANRRREAVVRLENERLRIGVLPGIGGRIIRLIDKQSGWNHMLEDMSDTTLPSIGQGYFNYGGYEEYIGSSFAGPGWEEPFRCTRVEEPDRTSLVLEADINGYRLRRRVSLLAGDSADVAVVSRLTNVTDETRTIKLRAHPSVTLGLGAGDHRVTVRTPAGTFETHSLNEVHESLPTQPRGLWAAVCPETGRGLALSFSNDEASCYLCRTGDDRFTMELFGHDTELAPGESVQLQQVYRVLGGVRGDPATVLRGIPLLKAHRTSVAPVGTYSVRPGTHDAIFVPGLAGQALRLSTRSAPVFPGTVLAGNAGTLEVWVRPVGPPKGVGDSILLTGGQNAPDWFVVAIADGRLTFTFKNGRKPYRGPGEFYASLTTQVVDWGLGEWHHLAVVWANGAEGKGLLRVYIDGTLREARSNCTLGVAIPPGRAFRLGYPGKSFPGDVDELRLSNRPRTSAEIANAYRRGRSGGALQVDVDTLLLLHFDDSLEGQARAVGSLDAFRIRRALARLKTEGGR
jgi:hypothetical protein